MWPDESAQQLPDWDATQLRYSGQSASVAHWPGATSQVPMTEGTGVGAGQPVPAFGSQLGAPTPTPAGSKHCMPAPQSASVMQSVAEARGAMVETKSMPLAANTESKARDEWRIRSSEAAVRPS
jgi:hypothetical protein